MKEASKPLKPSKGERSPFSLSLEGFEAFPLLQSLLSPFVLLLKAFEGFERGFEALKGASQHLFGFISSYLFFFVLFTPTRVAFSFFRLERTLAFSEGFVWFLFPLVSFSSFLTPKKRSRVAFLLSFWRERWLFEGGFEGFEGSFVLALKGFEAFQGFKRGFVLTFEALEGFPSTPPRPLRPLDLRRLRRLRRSCRARVLETIRSKALRRWLWNLPSTVVFLVPLHPSERESDFEGSCLLS